MSDTNNSNKKRSASDDDVVDLTTNKDDDDDKETQRPAKRPSRDTATTAAAVPPMRPRLDPFHDTSLSNKRKCVIYLCCDEGTSGNNGSFLEGLQKCQTNCSPKVHKHCFQMDATRHITLWNGDLSNAQVASIQQVCDISHVASKMLPVTIDFEKGFNSWKAGNYIGLSTASTKTLKGILESMESENFSTTRNGGKVSCDHLSLYRKRGMWSAAAQLKRVRAALQNHQWGRLQGISLRIKELGGPYDECKVLAEVAAVDAAAATAMAEE